MILFAWSHTPAWLPLRLHRPPVLFVHLLQLSDLLAVQMCRAGPSSELLHDLSVKVLPPPSNQWAFSSLNPLIKRHLRRSLPWAPHIKSRPHPLPRCPAPPILLLLCFIFHHHPYCPKGCALIYRLSLQAQSKLCKNRDFACNVYCSVSLILQHKLAWTHCRYSVNVCLMDEKALTVLKQEIPFHITVCVSMGCVCIHTQYDLTQPAVLYINERCCISDQWKE